MVSWVGRLSGLVLVVSEERGMAEHREWSGGASVVPVVVEWWWRVVVPVWCPWWWSGGASVVPVVVEWWCHVVARKSPVEN